MPTRTVAYLRVSTDKQADRGVSLDAQRAKLKAYAELYELELVWRQARRVLLWWTPARVEEEALRRAGDDVDTSVIAREHHLFLAIYLKWQE